MRPGAAFGHRWPSLSLVALSQFIEQQRQLHGRPKRRSRRVGTALQGEAPIRTIGTV